MTRIKSIYLIARDTVNIAIREKWMYGLLILGILFMMMANLPFTMSELEVFRDRSPTANALQVGLGFINIFTILIAIFFSLGTLQNYLAAERLILMLSKPIKRYELLLGIIIGVIFILLLNWFILTAQLWLVIFLNTKNPNVFIFSGLAPNILVAVVCASLVIFFYNIVPNFLSGILAFFILLASFGASVSAEPFKGVNPAVLAKLLKVSLLFLPKINSLWGIAMNTLGIFKIQVNSLLVIAHTLLFIVILNVISLIRFNRIK